MTENQSNWKEPRTVMQHACAKCGRHHEITYHPVQGAPIDVGPMHINGHRTEQARLLSVGFCTHAQDVVAVYGADEWVTEEVSAKGGTP